MENFEINSNSPVQEMFTLPSHGKIYVEDVNEHFTMRSMTINEEMQRLAPTDHKYELLCSIIDKCMVQGPGISSYDMCLGDYIYCLYMLRITTYGPKYKISPKCRYCDNINEEVFDLQDLAIKEYDDSMQKYVEFQLPSCKRVVTIQPQTPRSLDRIDDMVRMYKRKLSTSLDSTILCQIISTIRLVDSVELNSVQLEEFVRSLDMRDINTILNYSNLLNSSIGVDNRIVMKCDMCGIESQAQLSITSEFFRPTLDI